MGPVAQSCATISTTPACVSTPTMRLTLRFKDEARLSFICRPYEESRERLRPQDFCFYGYSLYCAPTTLGNQDYHEHTSGATVQTGYLKKATIAASYYWGDGVNFVALAGVPPAAPTPYNQPFLAREDTAGVSLTLRPIKPLKIENSYLFERLRTNNRHLSVSNSPRSLASAAESSTTTSCAASGTGSSRRSCRSV